MPVLKPHLKSIGLMANKASRLEQYPLPKADLFSMLAEGITFTKLDMSQAYQQLVLDDNLQKIATITEVLLHDINHLIK